MGQLSTESPFPRGGGSQLQANGLWSGHVHLTSGLGHATPSWKGCELTVGTQRFVLGLLAFQFRKMETLLLGKVGNFVAQLKATQSPRHHFMGTVVRASVEAGLLMASMDSQPSQRKHTLPRPLCCCGAHLPAVGDKWWWKTSRVARGQHPVPSRSSKQGHD